MGKIRTRVIGDETAEKEQKDEQKKKAVEKKMLKKEPKAEKVEEATEGTKVVESKAAKAQKEASSPKGGSRPKGDGPLVQPSGRKRGKNHISALKTAGDKQYSLTDAVALLKKIKYAKFDESVELHINVKQENMKGEISLPHSTGRTVRVAIVDEKVLGDLEKGAFEFDILITHPSYMPRLAKFARVLGPKGLMPNPKAGTISTNPQEVAKRYSGGLLKWKAEQKFPLVHQMIAKISQDDAEIVENAQKFVEAVGHQNISQVVIKTTMSPGLAIAL